MNAYQALLVVAVSTVLSATLSDLNKEIEKVHACFAICKERNLNFGRIMKSIKWELDQMEMRKLWKAVICATKELQMEVYYNIYLHSHFIHT